MDYTYDSNMSVNSATGNSEQRKTYSRFSFLCLCVFALLRPILCIGHFAESGILGMNYLELFSVLISYLLVLATLIQIYKFRVFPLDSATTIGLLFCLYLLFTIALGSYMRETFRLILPFVIFITVRVIITNERQIITLFALIFISYIIPLLGSAWLIMMGESIGKTIYETGLARYEGLYLKIHAFAHSMFIFIFIFLLFLTLKKNEKLSKKFYFYFLFVLCFAAIFNLFYSYTRNVWIGLFIMWIFYLWGQKKFLILALSISVAAIFAIVSSGFETIFFDFIEPLSGKKHISSLGAGRLGMWTNLIGRFYNLPWEVKFVGVGIGEEKVGFGITRGHIDFLSLLYSTGFIGLLFYLTFLLRVGYDIFKSRIERQLKYLYLGFLCAVIFMNFASNSYLSRIELGQYFYFILGFFYVLNDKFNKSAASRGKPQGII
jgi:hypothetical protein